MFIVHLKTGETVKVAEEDLEDFLTTNEDLIQEQHRKMGRRRATPDESTPPLRSTHKND